MNNYNWDAINKGVSCDAPLWKSYRCDEHGEYDDIIAIIHADPLSDGHRAAIIHGCVTPMTNAAARIVEAHKLTVGVYTPPPKTFDLEREMIKARCDYAAAKRNHLAGFPWGWVLFAVLVYLAFVGYAVYLGAK